jgi:MFS family permease
LLLPCQGAEWIEKINGMSQKRGYHVAAISSAIIGAGALVGFVVAFVVVHILSFHGDREAPGAGIFLITIWVVLIPIGMLLGSGVALLVYRRQNSN